jgi:hypothetical protein
MFKPTSSVLYLTALINTLLRETSRNVESGGLKEKRCLYSNEDPESYNV